MGVRFLLHEPKAEIIVAGVGYFSLKSQTKFYHNVNVCTF